MDRKDAVWKSQELSETYLEGVRGAIPVAEAQLEVMLRVVEARHREVERFLDLGCGDGILGRALLRRYPNASGVFQDFSEPMIEAARKKVGDDRHEYVVSDYGVPGWALQLEGLAPFDVIVSGFSIHHQPDERKRSLYGEMFGLLKPGGLFLNLEHVSSPALWIERGWDEMFVDSLARFHAHHCGSDTRETLGQRYYHRPDKSANLLAPLGDQCDWLRDVGFTDVDCFFKVFELALFGGARPE